VFTWEFNTPDEELAAMTTLPPAAQRSLITFMDALVFDPHGFQRRPEEIEGKAVRVLPFADGAGQVTVTILDRDRLVVIVQLMWFG
jgi:hypothetical protein